MYLSNFSLSSSLSFLLSRKKLYVLGIMFPSQTSTTVWGKKSHFSLHLDSLQNSNFSNTITKCMSGFWIILVPSQFIYNKMTIECSFLTQRHGHCTNKTRLRGGCVVEGGRDCKPFQTSQENSFKEKQFCEKITNKNLNRLRDSNQIINVKII